MITELDQLIPRDQYAPYLEGRSLDYLQPLVDLGFLPIGETENKTSVRLALKKFRAACQDLSWLSSSRNDLQPSAPPIDEPDSLEIKLLHLLVDMDGDFQLAKLPESGTSSILSSVIFYRLELHGFFKLENKPPLFDPNILHKVVAKLETWIPLNISALEWINLLGDIPELIRKTYDHGRLDEQIVCFNYKESIGGSFLEEIKSESEQTVAAESAELEQIKSSLKELRTDRIETETATPRAATTRKNRRRQSEVEKLRIEINAMVKQMQNILDQKKQASDKFQPIIQAAKEELRKAQVTEKHLNIDLKQLKDFRKSFKGLKKKIKKLKKENEQFKKELVEEFPNTPDLKSELTLQLKMLDQLKETKRNAPANKKDKLDKPINSAKKKITRLQKYFGQLAAIENQEGKLIERERLDQQIELKEKEWSASQDAVTRIENGLEILLQQQKDAVDEFDDGIIDEQEKLKKKGERYQELLKKLEKIPRRFRRELKEYLAPAFYEKVRRELLDRENATLFSETLNHPYNQFLVRLLQLHQWINGYYNGLIDNDLGKRTFNSIREIDRDIKGMKLRFVLYRLNPQNGTWLLNIRYLFAEMIDSLESFKAEDSFETVVKRYEAEIANNPDVRNQKDRIDKQLKKEFKEAKKNRKAKKLRRVYFGVRSLARSIVRGMTRLIQLIIKGLKFLFRLLKNFVLMLYREIREGLRKFAQGIAFLFGKRQVTTSFSDGRPAIVTRFDFDCDVRSFASLNAGEQIAAHSHNCRNITHNLQFALTLTATIIEWTFRAISLTWVTILIRIGLYFKKHIKNFLKKNIIGLTVKTIQG